MKIKQQQNFEKKNIHTPKATSNIQEVSKHQTLKKDSLKKDKICTKDTKFHYAYI